jgi:YfiH family protein
VSERGPGVLDANWPAPPGVRAFTTLRSGPGVSAPPFDRFNLGSRCGDDPFTVDANRRALVEAFGLPAAPRWLRQVHGTGVVRFEEGGRLQAAGATHVGATHVGATSVASSSPGTARTSPKTDAGATSVASSSPGTARTSPKTDVGATSVASSSPGNTRTSARGDLPEDAGESSRLTSLLPGVGGNETDAEPEADAAVTSTPGVVLAILTADCLPVVFAAADGREIAAAHAGWRGLAAGVLEATVAAMRTPAARLTAWLGPAAGPDAYEVGEAVFEAFVAHHPAAGYAFTATRRDHWNVDLYALARQRLVAAGVHDIHGGGLCTISDPGSFYSHRRDQRTGRLATLAWIQA